MQRRHSLSLTMIVRNEEVHVPRVLRTAHLYADEIVVVDTGSTDKTRERLAEFPVRIIDFQWYDDFSRARNHGIRQCTKDFIIWLDADDVVAEDEARKIRALMDTDIDWDVLIVPYIYARDEHGNVTVVTRRERVFRNGKGLLFEYPVHECIPFPPGIKVVTESAFSVLHDTVRRNEPSAARNLRILSRAVETEQYRDNFRMWWLLAQESEPQKAVLFFNHLLTRFCANINKALHSEVLVGLARKLLAGDRLDEALEVSGRAIALYPLWREPFFFAGQALWRLRRYPEALRMFLLAGTIPPPSTDIANHDASIYDSDQYYEWLFVTYFQLGDLRNMQRTIATVLKKNPRNTVFLERRAQYGPPRDA